METLCKCGHNLSEHFDYHEGDEAGCYHSENASFCSCNKTPEQVRFAVLTTRIAELETTLKKMVEKCEYCDEGFIEYQPSGLDGWLPTGDANFVTEPCHYCGEARVLLAKGQS